MAEIHSKRQIEEIHVEFEGTKRHKSYNQILSLLDDDEEEPTQDLSEIFTTFQQEIFDPLPDPVQETDPCVDFSVVSAASDCRPSPSYALLKEEEENDDDGGKEKVIKHLLEASDDELGIPHRVDGGDDEIEINGGDLSFGGLCDGLWEIEDEAANYYTLLQSELFM